MTADLQRGAVVTVRFDPAEGSEIRKTRPAVVVSNNAACRFDAVVQVVPVTGLPDRQLRPYEAFIDSDGSGLTRPSRAVTNQIRTITKRRIGRTLGRISSAEESALDTALKIQLALGDNG